MLEAIRAAKAAGALCLAAAGRGEYQILQELPWQQREQPQTEQHEACLALQLIQDALLLQAAGMSQRLQQPATRACRAAAAASAVLHTTTAATLATGLQPQLQIWQPLSPEQFGEVPFHRQEGKALCKTNQRRRITESRSCIYYTKKYSDLRPN